MKVLLKTNYGDITIELYEEKAPITVANFIKYVKDKHFNNTLFHRVIEGFMIQGGGFTEDFKQKPTNSPIKNEADNGLKNLRGTIAMARTSDVNSATCQFFINTVDNSFLDFKGMNSDEYGYCVFGKVISGMNIVEKIEAVETGSRNSHRDVPKNNVEIVEANIVNEKGD